MCGADVSCAAPRKRCDMRGLTGNTTLVLHIPVCVNVQCFLKYTVQLGASDDARVIYKLLL